jgi:hypothetical protein
MATKNCSLMANVRRLTDAADRSEAQDWVDRETVDGTFKDERLARRFKMLLADIGGSFNS